jgi:hypothetical protein
LDRTRHRVRRPLSGIGRSSCGGFFAWYNTELTVVRLGLPQPLPQPLCRVLATTNRIENLNSTAREVCRRVKHWCSGEMILRWTCAAMREAEGKFRRVQGFKGGMPMLFNALRRNDERISNHLFDGALDPAHLDSSARSRSMGAPAHE